MGHDFFTTASFGKRVEFTVIAKMLKSGLDIYLPMVDDKGIDCLIRKSDGTIAEIQIKGRSKNCDIRNAGRFAALSIEPRPKYFLIFYSENCENGAIWLMPSSEFVKLAYRNTRGKNAGKYSLNLCGASTGSGEAKEASANKKYDIFRVRGDFSEELFN